jgi:hypothetical protein
VSLLDRATFCNGFPSVRSMISCAALTSPLIARSMSISATCRAFAQSSAASKASRASSSSVFFGRPPGFPEVPGFHDFKILYASRHRPSMILCPKLCPHCATTVPHHVTRRVWV